MNEPTPGPATNEAPEPGLSEATLMSGMNETTTEPGMLKEQIALPDGRYLIYYTFEEEVDAEEAGAKATDDAPS